MYSITAFGNLEVLIQEKIKNILEADPVQCDVNWDLIKLLGDYLKIQNYNTNLFSHWILKSLLQQVIYNADALNKSDYILFICWIFEEINLIRYTADMTKEKFFQLMNEIFRMAMSKIVDGQGLLHPLQLINEVCQEESESISKIYTAKCENEITCSTTNGGESTINTGMQAVLQFESSIKYFETLLHMIIKATYELFSRELNYTLIQMASLDEENYLTYTVPYHFRKARAVKKVETSRKTSNISNSKGKTINKRKFIRKNYSDNYTVASSDSDNNFQRNYYILPLSVATACQDFAQLAQLEREAKNNYNV